MADPIKKKSTEPNKPVTEKRVNSLKKAQESYVNKYGSNRNKWPKNVREELENEEELLKQDLNLLADKSIQEVNSKLRNELKKPFEERDFDLVEKYESNLKQINENKLGINKTKKTVKEGQGMLGYETGFLDNMMVSVFGDKFRDYYYNKSTDIDFDSATKLLGSEDEPISSEEELGNVIQGGFEPSKSTSTSTSTSASGTTDGLPTDRQSISTVVNDFQKKPDGSLEFVPTAKKAGDKLATTVEDYKTTPFEEPKWQRDWPGLVGAGTQFVLGMEGANTEIPRYDMSPEMRTTIDESMQRRNQGLSPEEMSLAQTLSDRSYAYSVDNARKLSGGSAGIALASAGQAVGGLQDAYAQIGVQDVNQRRQNQAIGRQAAGIAENINQFQFGMDYEQAMMTKQAGAGLAQQGLENLKSITDEERYYGPGTQNWALQNEHLKKMHMQNEALENSQRNFQNNIAVNVKGSDNSKVVEESNVQTGDDVPLPTGGKPGEALVNSATDGTPQEELPTVDTNKLGDDTNESAELGPLGIPENELADYGVKVEEEDGEQVYVHNGFTYKADNEAGLSQLKLKLEKEKEKKKSQVTTNSSTPPKKAMHTGSSTSNYNFDEIVSKVVSTESGGKSNAHNKSSGARGSMQLMPHVGLDKFNKGGYIKNAEHQKEIKRIMSLDSETDRKNESEKFLKKNPEVEKLFFDNKINKEIGTQMVEKYVKKYNNNYTHALMAYNWGPGNVDSYIKNGHGLKTKKNPTGKIPDETKNYIKKILGEEEYNKTFKN